MDNSFQTSFIPKKPIIANGANISNVVGGEHTSIFMVVSIFIFIVMLVAFGGLYLYKGYLTTNQKQLSDNLFKIRDSFDKDTIAELELYDKRTSVAKNILNNHIILSPLFKTLDKLTLPSIQYTKFEHTTNNGVFSVSMTGIARDYKSIALQADVFNTKDGNMFKDIIFSNLTKDKNNFVTFNIEFNVDPALLSYSNNITNIKTDIENTNTVTDSVTNIPVIQMNPTSQQLNDSVQAVGTNIGVSTNPVNTSLPAPSTTVTQ